MAFSPPSIALDSNGKAHISHSYYYSLGYVTNTSGSWVRTTIDSAEGTQTSSISLDANNKVHISYYDAANGDLKYASNSSGSWLTSAIDSVGDLGGSPSIALYSSKAHISYYDATNGDLKYASADVIPPTGSVVINSGNDYTANPFVTLTLTCSDGATGSGCSQMQFSNDNSTWSTAETYADTKASWQVTLVDGVKTVYARFKDAEGNWSIVYSDTINFDTTNPTGTITINSGAAGTNNATVTLTLACLDISGCAQMQFSNDNTTWSSLESYATTKTWDMAAGDGTKTVYVKFKDNAGSMSAVKSDTIVLDTTGPAAPVITSPTDGSNTTKQTPAITGTAEANSTVTVYDGATTLGIATTNGSGAWSYTTATLSVGAHAFTAKAADAAGNVSAASAAVNITVVDTTPPDTNITSNPINPSNSSSASFSFSATETATFECKLDGGSYAPCTSPASYTGLSDGSHTFYVKATDSAGNADATPASYTWTIDTTAPTVAINAVTTPTNVNNQTITGTVEAGATVSVATDTAASDGAATVTGTTWSYAITWLVKGANNITVTATDAAGNTATATSSIYYDTFGVLPANGNVDGTGYSITRVDGYDLIKLSIAFGSTPSDANWNPVLDLDKNGTSSNKIDGSDLIVLGTHFGEVTP